MTDESLKTPNTSDASKTSVVGGARERVLDAYRVRERWAGATAITAVVSAGGFAFKSKMQRAFRRMEVRVELREPRVRIHPAIWGGLDGVLDGQACRIEDANGRTVDEREDPRKRFPYGRRLFRWDRLDQAYFSGYALWNYLAFPALVARDDIEWTEPRPNVLEARFPTALPTHCPVQRFHLAPESGLLRQHDYTAEVFGQWAKAANVVLAHDEWEGVPYPSRRRVTPRRADGTPGRFPVLVWIEIDGWKLV